jgi:hypothetical protein
VGSVSAPDAVTGADGAATVGTEDSLAVVARDEHAMDENAKTAVSNPMGTTCPDATVR